MKLILASTLLVILALLTSCSAHPAQPTTVPASTDIPQPNMPNPTAVYWEPGKA